MDKYKKNEVSLSTFNYLFSELISYLFKKDEMNVEGNLKRIGGEIGLRLFNIMIYRQKITQRESRIIPMLKLIQVNVFKYIFGRQAEKVVMYKQAEDKRIFVIKDNAPVILKYIPENDHLNCSVFVAGMIQTILCSAGFTCEVESQTMTDQQDRSKYPETQYLVTFTDEVLKKYRLQ